MTVNFTPDDRDDNSTPTIGEDSTSLLLLFFPPSLLLSSFLTFALLQPLHHCVHWQCTPSCKELPAWDFLETCQISAVFLVELHFIIGPAVFNLKHLIFFFSFTATFKVWNLLLFEASSFSQFLRTSSQLYNYKHLSSACIWLQSTLLQILSDLYMSDCYFTYRVI